MFPADCNIDGLLLFSFHRIVQYKKFLFLPFTFCTVTVSTSKIRIGHGQI
mgnify:FL=1